MQGDWGIRHGQDTRQGAIIHLDFYKAVFRAQGGETCLQSPRMNGNILQNFP